jgi:hypothetical protein
MRTTHNLARKSMKLSRRWKQNAGQSVPLCQWWVWEYSRRFVHRSAWNFSTNVGNRQQISPQYLITDWLPNWIINTWLDLFSIKIKLILLVPLQSCVSLVKFILVFGMIYLFANRVRSLVLSYSRSRQCFLLIGTTHTFSDKLSSISVRCGHFILLNESLSACSPDKLSKISNATDLRWTNRLTRKSLLVVANRPDCERPNLSLGL